MARSPRVFSYGSTRSARLRLSALVLAFAVLGGMRLMAGSGGALGSFDRLLSKAVTGPELEGPLSPAGEWLISQRAGDGGVITAGSYARALEQASGIRDLTAELAPEMLDAEWTNLGPRNIGGRVVEVAVDPTRFNACISGSCASAAVYAAAASGGVWKSGDGGTTWQYAWQPELTQSMGALAIGNDGVIYAGTGEANPGGGSIVWGGTGIYRSGDQAQTWQHIGLPGSGAIGRLAVDPKDPKRVFAAAAGNLFVPGGQRGLYRSTDRGDTWELVLPGENATTGAIDVSIDPVNPNNILTAMWDRVRLPTHRMYGGVGSGVHLSRDGGDTWQEVTLPGNVAPEQVGRIGVAFAPSDPKTAYAVVASKLDGSGVGLWRSNDGGLTWAKTANEGSLSQSSYGWWFGKVWPDPADDERVFVAGLELVESTDGGRTFTAHGVSTAGVVASPLHHLMPHADQHGMAWDPSMPGRVYLANDGGVYRSEANGRVGTWVGSVLQGWTQHYSVDVNEAAPDQVISGLQDNMCRRSLPAAVGTSMNWSQIGICGDGLQTLINPVDPTWTYTCSQYGACGVQRGGVPDPRRPGQLVGAKPPGQRYGWMTPLEFDPTNPSVMYFGSNVLSRSTDNGITFQPISPDLTTDAEQLDPNNGYKIYSTITAVAISKSNANVIYVGTDDGLVWRTGDLGGSWTLLTDLDDDGDGPDQAGTNGLPNDWVTRLTVDPANENLVYAAFSEFRKGSNAARVVRSTDGGQTWKSISGNLPAAPVNEIVSLPGGKLAVGTDVGAFLSQDGGATWLTLGSNMPAVPILDLRYHAATNTLTAATFGHGVQRIALP